jgi:putative alpha-1,2-mannosidase
VRWILDNKYGDRYDGLDGNDDGGTLSAWYVLSALGLYPVAGSDKYQLGAPLFERAEVKLKRQPLVIVAENYATNHPYARQVWLNGVSLDRSWIRHAEIEQGGVLKFAMSPEPAKR